MFPVHEWVLVIIHATDVSVLRMFAVHEWVLVSIHTTECICCSQDVSCSRMGFSHYTHWMSPVHEWVLVIIHTTECLCSQDVCCSRMCF